MSDSTIQLKGIFYPAPAKKSETGLNNPHVLFVANATSDGSSRALLFEPSAVVNMPESFDTGNEVSIELYPNKTCKRKVSGAYVTEAIQVALQAKNSDFTFTPIHSTYV